MNDRSGSVLILSLWVLAILIALSISLSFRVRINLRLARFAWDEIQLVQEIKKTILEQCLQTPPARSSPTQDEYARINLNTASLEVLKRLLNGHDEVALDILNWRSSDCGGTDPYSNLGYACRKGRFKSVDELRLIHGMTPEIFADVEDFVAVDTTGEVNLNTASERVMTAVGLAPSLVRKILFLRKGGQIFEHIGTVKSLLISHSAITPEEEQSLSRTIQEGLLTVRSDLFHLDIHKGLSDSPAHMRVTAVASKTGRILQWKEIRGS